MTTEIMQGGRRISAGVEIPRMVSATDFEVLGRVLQECGPFRTIVEFGPWLGAISAELARAGDLHVVDNFQWTNLHAKRLAGLHEPGESFRDSFERNLQDRGLSVTVHVSSFETFRWSGLDIGLCLIDAPKKPDDLRACLAAACPGLAPGCIVMVKNGLYHKYMPMMRYIESLVVAGAFEIIGDMLDERSNFIVLRALLPVDELRAVLDHECDIVEAEADALDGPMAGLPEYQVGLMQAYARSGDWPLAAECLSRMRPERKIVKMWDKLEPVLLADEVDPTRLGRFSEVLAVHHTVATAAKPPKSFKASLSRTLQAYWIHNADKAWRGNSFHPEILEKALNYGYLKECLIYRFGFADF